MDNLSELNICYTCLATTPEVYCKNCNRELSESDLVSYYQGMRLSRMRYPVIIELSEKLNRTPEEISKILQKFNIFT